ncbi:MAG: hypothetical protein KDD19_12310 [Phaeodactylibacter sp.]|nr:hypothetical protein [Phaeodactylibacter sp.]MCB9052254.1 hypothetical protein [Lewinellaceae bacterium]
MNNHLSFKAALLPVAGMLMISAPAFPQQPVANSLLGTVDIPAYIEDAPELAPSLAETAQRAFGDNLLQPSHQAIDHFYQPAEERIREVQQRYEDFYQEKMKGAGPDMGAMYGEIERNPIVKNMGGVQAIRNMNQEEAEKAANQAAEQFLESPFSASGVNSPGMTALYQKMMSDPAYAKRFEKMNEQERMAELQKYMANDPTVSNTPERTQKMRQEMQRRDKAADAMLINEKITELTHQIYTAAEEYGKALQAIERQPGNHMDIIADFNRKYDALPEIIAGEAGRVKDPGLEKKLRIETATLHRELAAAELEQQIILLGELKTQYKKIAADYMQFITSNGHRVNGDPAGLYDGTNTELNLANFESSLLGLALEAIKQSRGLTASLAAWEKNYQEVMHQYRIAD